MLVDNAIVVLENIFRNHKAGMTYRQAAIEGTAEVGGAITASTYTTIVVFLPIVLPARGIRGDVPETGLGRGLFILSSLFVAILIIPLMVARFFRDGKTRTRKVASVSIGWYHTIPRKFLQNKTLIIILSVVLLGATWLILPGVGSEFMPRAESNEFTIELKLPEGTRLERTAETTARVEQIINSLLGEKVNMLYSHTGASTTTGGTESDIFRNENSSIIKVFLSDSYAEYSNQAIELIESKLADIPGLEVSFTREESALQSTLGTDEQPFVVEISGEDLGVISDLTEQAREKLLTNPNLYNITTSLDQGAPEVDVVIDRYRASYFGIPVETIVSQIKSSLNGSSAGEFEHNGEIKDITVKLQETPLNQLKNMMVTSGTCHNPVERGGIH
ncbi:MAG: efflux RND transporter permease subunit [Bacteroidales bacterium]